MYDLLIKGGRVIDPEQDVDGTQDIAINRDKIVEAGSNIPSQQAHRVIDAAGKIVTPGLIDLHCHVYDRSATGIHPDDAGVKQGVTTVVDCGSTGQANFSGLLKYTIPSALTTVFCFLALSSRGIHRLPELRRWQDIDLDATTATIEDHRDVIKGIKLRLVGKLVAIDGIEVIRKAKGCAAQFGLPIMVHIGDYWDQVPPAMTGELLSLMEPGDILSHAFTAKRGGALRPDGTVLPELKPAMERGVVLDVAHGKANFSYDVARKMMAQGILPTTISSDVGEGKLCNPVYGLTVTMSKFLALGLSLNQVIRTTTINPARVLNIERRVGSLKPGMDADISILEILSGKWKLADSERQTLEVDKLIVPTITVKSGQLLSAKPVGEPEPVG